ncbi:HNH endonuclease signature motif containing protein [Cellulosimicrobium arenosum]|uniref:DUF222 domain-containing protein n=1 Tax=Cellulosimicrobium arenosum TaxID=2708133 RepID=A0A927G792_9MICO|nr:HNH endonuclease signature motif containing protein [Cellulosimicrobium arenosum]MBD8078167.1 DUF222 domain-containing protein [Cellulosimicrobium arenosum]
MTTTTEVATGGAPVPRVATRAAAVRAPHVVVTPPVGSLEALAVAVDEVVGLQRKIDALTAARTVAVEGARLAGLAVHRGLVDDEAARLADASPTRRVELAHRAVVAELACALRVRESVADGLLRDAEVLCHRAGSVLDGLSRGEFSYAHASIVARAVADLDPQAAVDVVAACVGRAGSTTVGAFRRLVRRAREQVHPEPLGQRHEKAVAKRGVWVDQGEDGMAWLSALLPATSAHAICDRLTTSARDARHRGDARTVAQLRADVLVDLALATPDGRAGDDGAGGLCEVASLADVARRVTPRVHVTVPVLTLLGGDDAAHLDGHGPIDPDTARRLTASAPSLRRILTHPETGAVLSVGRESYAVPADLRAWLTVRDETCRFPGCTVPARRCDVDHTDSWADGGATGTDNLAHLCRKHHVLKHQTAWGVEHLPDGVLSWTSPTGVVYLTQPGTRPAPDHDLGPPEPPPPDWIDPAEIYGLVSVTRRSRV